MRRLLLCVFAAVTALAFAGTAYAEGLPGDALVVVVPVTTPEIAGTNIPIPAVETEPLDLAVPPVLPSVSAPVELASPSMPTVTETPTTEPPSQEPGPPSAPTERHPVGTPIWTRSEPIAPAANPVAPGRSTPVVNSPAAVVRVAAPRLAPPATPSSPPRPRALLRRAPAATPVPAPISSFPTSADLGAPGEEPIPSRELPATGFTSAGAGTPSPVYTFGFAVLLALLALAAPTLSRALRQAAASLRAPQLSLLLERPG